MSCGQPQTEIKQTSDTLEKGNTSDTTQYENVSMINLIATPTRYHGKKVIVEGFVHVEFEGNMIYFSENDYKHGLDKNALWIDITREQMNSPAFKNCQNKYAFVKGIFDMNDQGHYSVNSGAITKISLIEPLK